MKNKTNSCCYCIQYSILGWKWKRLDTRCQVVLYFSLADEREDVQKKTFTKWINAQYLTVSWTPLLYS
uniref:Uncharacterized protein n=1 Tax=Anas platyrhynchos platyrhynchos TaxID=8840 RepID=A0A493U0N4_ANAPP